MKLLKTSLLSVISMATSHGAVIIAQYDFQSIDFTSSDTELNSTAAGLAAGITGLNGFDTIDTTFQDGEAFETGTTSPALAVIYSAAGAKLSNPRADLQEAIDNSRYLSFTINPLTSQQIDFTTVSLALGKSSSGANMNVSLLSSLDGFSLAADEIDSTKTAAGNNFTANLSFDLASLTTVTSATEFRLYFHTTASTGAHDFSIDNIRLEGDLTTIPEPSSTALLGLGGLALILRRRR